MPVGDEQRGGKAEPINYSSSSFFFIRRKKETKSKAKSPNKKSINLPFEIARKQFKVSKPIIFPFILKKKD